MWPGAWAPARSLPLSFSSMCRGPLYREGNRGTEAGSVLLKVPRYETGLDSNQRADTCANVSETRSAREGHLGILLTHVHVLPLTTVQTYFLGPPPTLEIPHPAEHEFCAWLPTATPV